MPSCCPPESWPYLAPEASYEAKGELMNLDVAGGASPLPCYVSKPSTPSTRGIIVLPEIFGWAGRLKGITDSLADAGYHAVLPDMFRGDTANGKPDMVGWIAQTTWGSIAPDFDALMAYFAGQGVTSVGAIGFCWGAWSFAKAASEGVSLRGCVACHPSVKLEEYAFKSDQAKMMSAASATCPILLLNAGNDCQRGLPGGDLADIVTAGGGGSHVYPDMSHGWVTRGDVSDEKVKRDVEDAMTKAVEFFGSKL